MEQTTTDTHDPSVWNLLCRINVEYNYARYVAALARKGKRAFQEGEEDHGLIGAFLVTADEAEDPRFIDRVEDEPRFLPYSSEPEKEVDPSRGGSLFPAKGIQALEETLVENSKHYDGAVIVDGQKISNYLVFDSIIRQARLTFNCVYRQDVPYFSRIIPHFVPTTFSKSSGGAAQMGAKSKNALSAALVFPFAESYLLKVTAFGTTGTGKVIRMNVHQKRACFQYDEFFLYHSEALGRLNERPNRAPLAQEYFDPPNGVVGISRRYESNLNAPFEPGSEGIFSIKPRLVSCEYVAPTKIGIDPAQIVELQNQAPHVALGPYGERATNWRARNREPVVDVVE